MEENFTLTVPLDFDFNSLNLRYDPTTNFYAVNIEPIIEILKLSGIDPDMEITENQLGEIISYLYQFHLSQNKAPFQLIEDGLSEVTVQTGVSH